MYVHTCRVFYLLPAALVAGFNTPPPHIFLNEMSFLYQFLRSPRFAPTFMATFFFPRVVDQIALPIGCVKSTIFWPLPLQSLNHVFTSFFFSSSLHYFTLTRPVLSLKKAFLGPVIGMCTSGKSC